MTDPKNQPSHTDKAAHPSRQPDDLKDLEKGLRRARGEADTVDARPVGASRRQMGLAARVSTELVAAVFVGGLLGWYMDKWFGTKPWLFLVFLLLGLASGTLSAFREANRAEIQDQPD
jgi:ATP synthase protein I